MDRRVLKLLPLVVAGLLMGVSVPSCSTLLPAPSSQEPSRRPILGWKSERPGKRVQPTRPVAVLESIELAFDESYAETNSHDSAEPDRKRTPAHLANDAQDGDEVWILGIEEVDSPSRDEQLAELPVVIQVPRSRVQVALRQAGARGPEASSDDEPWWQTKLDQSLLESSQPRPIVLDDMIVGALRYSSKVRAISDTPLIEELAITEAEARFDWRSFMESRFDHTSDPVSTPKTQLGLGSAPLSRFRDRNWRYTAGLRRRTLTGAEFEVGQRIGYQDNNSALFDPTQQANARLALSFKQPLLNGAGVAYNESLILLAQVESQIAHEEFVKQLQDHLIEVTGSYWELYRSRAVLLQKRRLLEQAQKILDELEARRRLDAMQSQIVRARAAVAARTSEIIRAETTIRNTEARLRVLVNDPKLVAADYAEMIPRETPTSEHFELALNNLLTTALEHRPEIQQAAENVHAASIRLGVSRNELLPVLDLVTETYVAGLSGESNLARAYGSQFSDGEPGYSIGLVFEVPLCNRAAKARYKQRQLEMQQLTYQLALTTEQVKAEVEVAAREVETAYREMQSKYRSVQATAAEVRYLQERWRLLPGEDQAASFLLEDLLQAQERLAVEEAEFVTAQVAHVVALSNLKRSTGTLLEAEEISTTRVEEDCLPQLRPEKRRPAASP